MMIRTFLIALLLLGVTGMAHAAAEHDTRSERVTEHSVVAGKEAELAKDAVREHANEAHGALEGTAEVHMSGEPSVFNGTIAQSAAALLSFFILLAVLYVLAWKPILTGLQDREKKIKDDLEAAEAGAKRAKTLVAEYEVKLAEAQTAAGKVIDQARADAERIAAQLKDRTQQDILQMKERAESDIRAAKEQALTEVYAQAATLSTQVASRILKREINAADQQTLVQASLDELVKRN